jgi:hypothetical protein
MRWMALIVASLACAAVVALALAGGWFAEAEAIAGSPVVPAPEPAARARIDAELDRAAHEEPVPTRTEAALPLARLEICVVDDRGKGLAGIRLRVFRRDELYLQGRIGAERELAKVRTTGADGLAVWEDLAPGEDWHWIAPSDLVEYDPPRLDDELLASGAFTLSARDTTHLRGVVPATLTLVGRVLDGDSRPRSGVRVTALRRDADPRTVLRVGTTDAEGSFALSRVRLAPLRLECVVQDAADLVALVTRDFDPVSTDRLDVGVLKLDGRTLRISLRAVDPMGRDVTALAAAETARSLPVQIEGCTENPQGIAVRLGGTFRMVGFECPDTRIKIPEEPPRPCCAPGWAIVWDRSVLEVSEGMAGEVDLDVHVVRAADVAFSASAIHRDGVPDQAGVAVLKVSLLPEDGVSRVEFEMRALLGLPFDNTRSIPPGRYELLATCEDEGALWTAARPMVVTGAGDEPIRIDLVRAR